MPSNRRIACETSVLTFFSYLLLRIFTGFQSHPFAIDDNFTQWEPVANYAFSELFHGHYPYWNPYQWAGFRIDEVGYYGLFNPVMIVSYLLSLMTPWDLISIYVLLVYCLGILAAYRLCLQGAFPLFARLLFPLSYGCSPGYFLHGNWYYIFNVFFLMPVCFYFLISLFSSADHRINLRHSTAFGACVSLAFYLGNAQYAVYLTAALYGVWILTMLLLPKRPELWRGFLWSALTFIFFSVPVAELYLRAGSGSLIDPAPSSFTTPILQSTISLFIPFGLASFLKFPNLSTFPFCSYGNCGNGAIIALAIAGVFKQISNKKRTFHRPLCISLFLVLGIILALASGIDLLLYIPVFRSFRWAFKWLFLAPPIIFAAAISGLHGASRSTFRWSSGLCFCSVIISCFFTRGLDWGVRPSENDFTMTRSHEKKSKYTTRSAFGARKEHTPVMRLDHERLMANFATTKESPSIVGYHLSCPTTFSREMSLISGKDWYMGRHIDLDQWAFHPNFYLDLLRKYSIQYVILHEEDLSSLPPEDLQITRIENSSPFYRAEIQSCPPLVVNRWLQPLSFRLHSDGVEVLDVKESDMTVQAKWWALDGFSSTLIDQSGKKLSLALNSSEFLEAKIPAGFSGRVIFHIVDYFSIAAFLASWVISLLCGAAFFIPSPTRF